MSYHQHYTLSGSPLSTQLSFPCMYCVSSTVYLFFPTAVSFPFSSRLFLAYPQHHSSPYYILRSIKMSFDRIFDLTAGVYFNFYNIHNLLFCVLFRLSNPFTMQCTNTYLPSHMPVRKTTPDETLNCQWHMYIFIFSIYDSNTCSTSTPWYGPLPSPSLSHVFFAQLLWRAGPPISSTKIRCGGGSHKTGRWLTQFHASHACVVCAS